MSPHQRAAATAAVACIVLTAVSACTPAPPEESSPGASSTTSSQPPPASVEQNPQDSAEQAAGQAVLQYADVMDRVTIDPSVSIDELATVARGDTLNYARQIIVANRKDGLKQVGPTDTTIISSQYQSNNAYDVQACLDVSKAELVDAAGDSVTTADRPPKYKYQYTVQNDNGEYFVTQNEVTDSC